MTEEDRLRMLRNWRGRRLLACRAVDELEAVIRSLGREDGSQLPPDGGLPAVSEGLNLELLNMASLLLRLVLRANDGHVSNSRLQRF